MGTPGSGHFGGAQLKALFGRGGQQDRRALGRAHKVAVAGIAGVGHEDFIAPVNQCKAGQLQSRRSACGDHDAACGHLHVKALRVPAADGLPQGVEAERWGVLGVAGGDDGLCGGLHAGWGGEVGLTNIQEHHRPFGVRDLAGFLRSGLGHLHHPKGLNPFGSLGDAHADLLISRGRIGGRPAPRRCAARAPDRSAQRSHICGRRCRQSPSPVRCIR